MIPIGPSAEGRPERLKEIDVMASWLLSSAKVRI